MMPYITDLKGVYTLNNGVKMPYFGLGVFKSEDGKEVIDAILWAIGVSNFLQHHLDDVLEGCEIVPMVNQMEFHPYLAQAELLDFCKLKGIQYEAWSPLMRGKILDVPLMKDLSKSYGKTEVQIVLRWNLQKGVVTIPKSIKKERITANADLFDFELSEEDMVRIDQLDKGYRVGPDPDNFDFSLKLNSP